MSNTAQRCGFKLRLALALGLAAAAALPAQADPSDDLARLAGLPAPQVRELLADCDGGAQNQHLCAWRDKLVAQQRLAQALEAHEKRTEPCAAAFRDALLRRLDNGTATCIRTAARGTTDGVLRDTQRYTCEARATEMAATRLGGEVVCTGAEPLRPRPEPGLRRAQQHGDRVRLQRQVQRVQVHLGPDPLGDPFEPQLHDCSIVVGCAPGAALPSSSRAHHAATCARPASSRCRPSLVRRHRMSSALRAHSWRTR